MLLPATVREDWEELGPGLGLRSRLGMGYSNSGFGGNINIKITNNAIIGVEVSKSSLLGHIHSGYGTSNLLLMRYYRPERRPR